MRFTLPFVAIVIGFGFFAVSALKNGFAEASKSFTDIISIIVLCFLAFIFCAIFLGVFERVKSLNARRTEGTHDISNEKFVDRVIYRAEEIFSERNPDLQVNFQFADYQNSGENGEYQNFFYKISNREIDLQEEITGKSYGFGLTMNKNSVSACKIEKMRGMNDKMDSIANCATGSVEVAAKFIASHSRSISDKAIQRNAKVSRTA